MESGTEQETKEEDTVDSVDPLVLHPVSGLPQLSFELREALNAMYAEWREEHPGRDVIDWAAVLRRPNTEFMDLLANLVNAASYALWDKASDDLGTQAHLVSGVWEDFWCWFKDRNMLVAKAARERREGRWWM